MSIRTGMRKAIVTAAAVAGVALAVQGAPAQAATQAQGPNVNGNCHPVSDSASDLSPTSRAAWASFICGGGHVTGGTARAISGAWIGWPTIIASATGQPITADQAKAWKNWDHGAYNAGRGAAMVVSGAYVGAPSVVLDPIKKGASPADLSPAQMRQVSFAIDPNSEFGRSVPGLSGLPGLPELPGLEALPISPMDLLSLLQGF
jgi:hypothetical protein